MHQNRCEFYIWFMIMSLKVYTHTLTHSMSETKILHCAIAVKVWMLWRRITHWLNIEIIHHYACGISRNSEASADDSEEMFLISIWRVMQQLQMFNYTLMSDLPWKERNTSHVFLKSSILRSFEYSRYWSTLSTNHLSVQQCFWYRSTCQYTIDQSSWIPYKQYKS